MCRVYCKLVDLARSTPPSLISDGLALFDTDVRRFSECTGIDTADTEWLQVQRSLRSLALHSPAAAYLSSLIKAGSLIPSDEFALESFSIFNSIVPPVHACNVRRSIASF